MNLITLHIHVVVYMAFHRNYETNHIRVSHVNQNKQNIRVGDF